MNTGKGSNLIKLGGCGFESRSGCKHIDKLGGQEGGQDGGHVISKNNFKKILKKVLHFVEKYLIL